MPARSEATATSPVAPGAYLTDGVHLFHVWGLFGSDRSPCVALEDCRTLELILFRPEDLAEAPLQPIRAPEEVEANPGG